MTPRCGLSHQLRQGACQSTGFMFYVLCCSFWNLPADPQVYAGALGAPGVAQTPWPEAVPGGRNVPEGKSSYGEVLAARAAWCLGRRVGA